MCITHIHLSLSLYIYIYIYTDQAADLGQRVKQSSRPLGANAAHEGEPVS